MLKAAVFLLAFIKLASSSPLYFNLFTLLKKNQKINGLKTTKKVARTVPITIYSSSYITLKILSLKLMRSG
jgi:hypothetical protein